MERIEVHTDIELDCPHAWEYYFNQINGWWPKEYHTSPKTKRFIIETIIGGKAFEDFGEGQGLIWGDVIAVDYPHTLQMRGNLTKEFGGPVVTFEKISFVQQGPDATRVTYTCDFVGEVSDSSINSLEKGWKDLIQHRFASYCRERGS